MSGPPTSFSSFPELPGLSAGPSKAPAFSSFPEIDLSGLPKSSDKKRSRPPSEERDRERRRRDRSRDRDDDRKRRERSRERERVKDREKRKHRDRDRSRERDDDRRKRDKDRTRDRDRDREHGRDRDGDREWDRDREHRRDKHSKRDDRDKHHGRSKSSRHDDDDERRKEKEDRRRRDRERAEELVKAAPKSEAIQVEDDGVPWYEARTTSRPAPAPLPSKAFFLDTVGDRDIARWNLTSSESTPRYRRDAGGRILGLPDGLRIVYSRDRTQKGVEIAKLGRPYIPRYSAKPLEGSASRHLGRILLRPSSEDSEPLGDITLIHRRKAIMPAVDLPDYRAISREKEESEDELEGVLGQVTTLQDSLKAKRVEFERHLSQYPDDVKEWIKYSTLHLQEQLSSVRKTGIDQAAQPTTRANAEVTLSLLDRALNAHRTNFHSTELHIAFLHAAEAFWPADKVTQRWKNVISQLSGRAPEEEMIQLYLGYIDWREGQGLGSSGSEGGTDEVVNVYIEVLDRLRATSDTRNTETREEDMVYLFLRVCLFLKQAGYTERALGAFQALMEITFFKPDHLRAPAPPFDRELWFTGVLQEFEDFWDSEIPRIGEAGGKGWKEMHASPEEVDFPRSRAPDISSDTPNPHERWLEAERQAEQAFSLPGRARDLDAPDDDAFHVILFEDVSPFLFPVQSPMARLQLIFAFFNFLGLPFTPPDVPTNSPASTDPQLRWTIAQNEGLRAAFWPPRPSVKHIAWQTVGGEPMEAEAPRTMASPFGCPVKSWISSRDSLFAGRHWFRDVTTLDLAHVDIDLARNVLNLLRPLVPDPSFVLNLFAFEAALSPKTGVKVAKEILSTDRDNLALWDGYARLERQRGKITAARQVYVTAIQAAMARMAERNDEDLQLDEAELWASWAEMEWEDGNDKRCLEVLIMAAGMQRQAIASCIAPDYEPNPPSPISVLKSRQHYESVRSQSASKLFLGALFSYYTDGIEAVKDSLTRLLDQLPKGHPQGEETLQLLVKIIHFHASRQSAPASLARSILESAIAKYPNSTEFLSLYLWGEASGRVYGRIQRLVSDLTGEDKGIVAMLWSVWAEAIGSARTFWDSRGGGAERVRRALDRSVNTKSGKRSAALWTLYIEFEAMMGRHSSAKALCYRAIAAVGGCKDLYLLPFSPALRPHFTPRELSSIAESMSERGIRIRVGTDTFWMDEEEEEGSDADEAAPITGDYEYSMLREREELKPY